MEEKSIRDISKRCRDLYQRGEKALAQKNYPFAIEMLREAVRVEPTFSEGRDKLRKAQLLATNNGNITGLKKLIADLTSKLGKGQKFLNSGNFAEALNVAEEALSKNPSNIKALQFMVKCGEAMDFTPIQVAAYKMIFKFDSKNVNSLRTMAQFYKSVNMIDDMIEAYQTICNLRPNDSDAISEMKSATAYAAMNRGNWENASSYRDIIKDKDKAKELDLMEMTQVRDAESLQAILATLTNKIEENGENITDRKRMAELYSQGEMWTQALECYEIMVELAGTTEPTIANIMTEIKANIFDQQILATEDEATKSQLLAEKDQMLFDHASTMVKRFPNDPAYRFDLGMALYNREAFSDALVELQQSQRNPRFKTQAGRFMGLCFLKSGQLDLAVDQLDSVLKELHVMNDDKKETLYVLGLVYEEQGNIEEAIRIFKEIFQNDVAFRDVKDRINNAYKRQA